MRFCLQEEKNRSGPARICDPQPHALAFYLALAYTGLGEIDQAFAWLERGFDERASFMDGFKVAPGFEPGRHAAFEAAAAVRTAAARRAMSAIVV